MLPASPRLAFVSTALAISLLASGGAVVLAQSPDPSIADAAPALLTAEDLPAGLVSVGGVTHEPSFDFDSSSFEAAGGIDAAAQTWQAPEVDPEAPIVVAFDFRFVFPDAGAARGYLDAAEPVLSESITGITHQADTPTVGDELRHYAGQLSQGELTVDVHNFLFQRGPVVAKVYLAGFGTTLEDALPIAEAAAARVDAWLAEAPVGTPIAAGSPGAAPAGSPGVTPDPAGDSGSVLRQWATEAAASSEYGSDSWSASQATGAPDVEVYSDDPRSWAPGSTEGSVEWLELRYGRPVVPTGVTVIESLGSGAVTSIEAFDAETGEWVELWSGQSPAIEEISSFSTELEPVEFATDRLRITLDTSLVVGWNEVDAVELVGTIP